MVMGGVAFIVYQGCYALIQSNVISLAISIFLAVLVYFAGIIKIGVVTEKELKTMPKGHLLVSMANMLRLL